MRRRKQYRQAQEAEAQLIIEKKKAEAVRYALEQEAEGIRAKGEAEAAAIQAKGEAEARAMEKMAEAYQKMNNQAALVQMISKILPDMAKNIAEPISAIDTLNIYDSGTGTGASGVSGMNPAVIKQVFDVVENTTGVNMSDIMRAETLEAKTDRHVTIDNIPDVNVNMDSTKSVKVDNDNDSEDTKSLKLRK